MNNVFSYRDLEDWRSTHESQPRRVAGAKSGIPERDTHEGSVGSSLNRRRAQLSSVRPPGQGEHVEKSVAT